MYLFDTQFYITCISNYGTNYYIIVLVTWLLKSRYLVIIITHTFEANSNKYLASRVSQTPCQQHIYHTKIVTVSKGFPPESCACLLLPKMLSVIIFMVSYVCKRIAVVCIAYLTLLGRGMLVTYRSNKSTWLRKLWQTNTGQVLINKEVYWILNITSKLLRS